MSNTTSSTQSAPAGHARPARLPLTALLVMALTGFVLIATETMPAGLLSQIASGLNVTEGTAGQLVSAYALGTVVATIPAVALTRGMRRKPVLLVGLLGFLTANIITVVSAEILLTLGARLLAGAFSGLLWGMLAGYARRITAPAQAGRALAIASIGTPLGLALGTPLGSWLGTTFDWRWSFAALSILTALIAVLALTLVPDAAGQHADSRAPLTRVFALPGVALILAMIFTWMLAHNIIYTYISAYLNAANLGLSVDVVLLTFGVAALIGIWITGAVIDRALRPLVLASISLFIVAGLTFIVGQHSAIAVLFAVVLWGIAFGGAAAQLQTAIGNAAGENADVANSMLGVSFNLAIFAAGIIGAGIIGIYNGLVLPFVMVVLALVALLIAFNSRRALPIDR